MALVKFSGGVGEMRGKLAGNIFSRNKGGAYVKVYHTPTNPQTLLQLAVRTSFGYIATAWSYLTQRQRDAWNEQAALIPWTNSVGDTFFLSGFGLFQKINQVTNQLNEDIWQDTPPNFTAPPGPDPISIDSTVAGQDIVITSIGQPTVPANLIFIIDGAAQSSAGVTNNNSRYKRLQFIDEGQPWGTADVAAAYIAIFGNLQLGQRIDLRLQAFSKVNGMVSPYSKANTIVVAGGP